MLLTGPPAARRCAVMRRRLLLVIAVLLAAGSGCTQSRYLVQATAGQLDMLHRSRPIATVVRDDRVPARTRALLTWVPHIKRYAETQGLTPSTSYERYADLRRPAAVWVVQGSAPLAFEPRQWSFPIVGSVPYLGFFDEGAANAFAQQLAREEPLDVDVRTAGAYSTLGWFSDPVLSTMIPDGPEGLGELANVILHESVHATVYVSDQSAFDESLASFVADRMTAQWLAQALGSDHPLARAWSRYQEDYQQRIQLLRDAWTKLDALYRSDAADEVKRAEKARILEALSQELRAARPINNATLTGIQTYGVGEKAFQRLFAACDQQWPRFLRAVSTLKSSDFSQPQAESFDEVLDGLAAKGCP